VIGLLNTSQNLDKALSHETIKTLSEVLMGTASATKERRRRAADFLQVLLTTAVGSVASETISIVISKLLS
jgi:hypothetical protein